MHINNTDTKKMENVSRYKAETYNKEVTLKRKYYHSENTCSEEMKFHRSTVTISVPCNVQKELKLKSCQVFNRSWVGVISRINRIECNDDSFAFYVADSHDPPLRNQYPTRHGEV